MRIRLTLTPLFLSLCFVLSSQVQITADISSGSSAYELIYAAGLGIEGPDFSSSACVDDPALAHDEFGDHITQVNDVDLEQDVFVFHSHIAEDNDRCVTFDRARIEIKGGPQGNSVPEVEHLYNTVSHYRWQFKLASDYIGASSFCHLFQNKAQGGGDTGQPVITITARTSSVEVKHNAGSGNPSGTLGVLTSAPLSDFAGKWVEVYMRQKHSNNGEFYVQINDVATGDLILSYENLDIDLFRGEEIDGFINRPKWGVYRSYNIDAGLKDEQVLFANFCSSETSADLCPSLLPDVDVGEQITGLLPINGSTNIPLQMPIIWDALVGATSYNVYFGTTPTPGLVLNTSSTSYDPTLADGTTYFYQIGALGGSEEVLSPVYSFSTLPNSDDGAWEVWRGNANPNDERTDLWEFNQSLADAIDLDTIIEIQEESGNNANSFFASASGNYRWRYRQGNDELTTVVLRVKPLVGRNNIMYVEFYGHGWRQKMRINRSNIKFERTDGGPEFIWPTLPDGRFGRSAVGYWDGEPFHVLRFTFEPEDGNMRTTLYLDESDVAFATGLSNTSSGSDYLEVGKAGSTNYGATLDYIAVNPTLAAPLDTENPLTQVPADLQSSAVVPLVWAIPLEGTARSEGNLLTWAVSHQINVDEIILQRSNDGRNFSTIKKYDGDGNDSSLRHFKFTDLKPQDQDNYYRVKQVDFNGRYDHSNTIYLRNENIDLKVFPNPAHGSILTVVGDQLSKTDSFKIYSILGELVREGSINSDQKISIESLKPGLYILSLEGYKTVNFIKE